MQKRILVIDDEPDILATVRFLLELRHYRVLTAQDGVAGLDLAQRRRPDLILLDIMMPAMNGLDVCRELKADTQTRHIPVIMLTARGDTESIVKAHRNGASDYIVKPFSPAILLGKIQKLAA